jgi:hypothetical protein
MSVQVSISRGFYRGRQVSGTYDLVKGYAEGAKGGYITIRNPDPAPGCPPVQRVAVEQHDFAVLDNSGNTVSSDAVVSTRSSGPTLSYEAQFIDSETEEQALERIGETFVMFDKIVDASARGVIRGLVVSGPPGIGKSFGVEKKLEEVNLFRKIEGRDPLYEIVSGAVSPIGLYQKLYFNRAQENVLVFDDSDGILFEEESLNLLKAALNSGHRRRICWNKESRVLAQDGIPDHFDFEGSIIFLTNIDFERSIAKGSRISSHLEAIMSRCHYLDLEISTVRDKILRIKQIVREGMLNPYNFTQQQENDIVSFVTDNAEYLREISLRIVKKIADFVKAHPHEWQSMAESTCLQKEAKFKRLVEKRKQDVIAAGVA